MTPDPLQSDCLMCLAGKGERCRVLDISGERRALPYFHALRIEQAAEDAVRNVPGATFPLTDELIEATGDV